MPEGSPYHFVPQNRDQRSAVTNTNLRQQVRSHAARVSRPARVRRSQGRPPSQKDQDYDIIVFEVAKDAPEPLDPAIRRHERTQAENGSRSLISGTNAPLLHALTGNTSSPISGLKVYHKPYVSAVVHHYVCHLAVPIPCLDGPSTEPLLRTTWLPLVLNDPITFQIVMLFTATHYATYADSLHRDALHTELLWLKQSALSSMVQELKKTFTRGSITQHQGRPGNDCSTDAFIAAVAKMASYEAIFGSEQSGSFTHTRDLEFLSWGGYIDLTLPGKVPHTHVHGSQDGTCSWRPIYTWAGRFPCATTSLCRRQFGVLAWNTSLP